jgi:hypothetical protein
MSGDGINLPRQEGVFRRGRRYYRVIKTYDDCTERHARLTAELAEKVRRMGVNALDLGDCYIAIEWRRDVAEAVMEEYARR